MQQALDVTLGATVTILARHAISTDGAPFMDVVAFKNSGDAYCRTQLPPRRHERCEDQEGTLTWESQEILGVAIISFTDPAKPSVIASRYVDGGGTYFSISPNHEPPRAPGRSDPKFTRHTNIELETLEAGDVDHDGHDEYVILVSHQTLEAYDNGETIIVTEDRKRLLVVREDLSLQFDGPIYQRHAPLAPDISPDNLDRLETSYTFEPPTATSTGQLVVTWCEVDPMITIHDQECVFTILCERPTKRVSYPYDAGGDSYPKAKAEQLRPVVTETDDCPE